MKDKWGKTDSFQFLARCKLGGLTLNIEMTFWISEVTPTERPCRQETKALSFAILRTGWHSSLVRDRGSQWG